MEPIANIDFKSLFILNYILNYIAQHIFTHHAFQLLFKEPIRKLVY